MRVHDRAAGAPTHPIALRLTTVAFAAGFVIHGFDHTVRGLTGDDHHATWPGTLQVAMGVLTVLIAGVVLAMVFTGARRAPGVAVVVGFGVAAFFVLIHATPSWGGHTDSFLGAAHGARVTAFSWVTAALGTLSAFALGLAGLRTRPRAGGDRTRVVTTRDA